MPKPISLRDLLRNLRSFGFDGPYSGGKHMFMVRGQQKLRVPNPHKGDISPSLLSEILKQGNISKKEWEQL